MRIARGVRLPLLVAATLVLAGWSSYGSAHGQPGGQQEQGRYMLAIDPQRLPPGALADLVAALARAAMEQGATQPYVVEQQVPYEVIYEQYHFSDRLFPKPAEAMVRTIFPDRTTVAGETIELPLLPVRPFARGADVDRAQFLDLSTQEYWAASFAEGLVGDRTAVDARDARYWAVLGPREQLEEIVSALPPRYKEDTPAARRVLMERVDPIGLLERRSCGSASATPVEAWQRPDDGESLKDEIRAAIEASKSELWVVDRFDGDCSHGRQVMEVVRLTLEAYGLADIFASRVKRHDLDEVYGNPASAKRRLLRYLATQPAAVTRRLGERWAEAVLANLPANHIPPFYLAAVYKDLLSKPDTATITTSVFTRNRVVQLPPREAFDLSSTTLFAAALNDPIDIGPTGSIDPATSFSNLPPDLAWFLVGAQLGQGQPCGAYSTQGKVHVLGPGSGWGHENGCLNPALAGTSYATPHVAVLMFLADAYWKTLGHSFPAVEKKRRLLLAGDVNPAGEDRYALPGVPRLDRLVLEPGHYAIHEDGKVSAVEFSGSVRLPGAANPRFFGSERHELSGLQLVDGDPEYVYIFDNQSLRWRGVVFDELQLELELDEVPTGVMSVEGLASLGIRSVLDLTSQ